MKKITQICLRILNTSIFTSALLAPSIADAGGGGGLVKVRTKLETFKTELLSLAPIIAIIILIILAIAYAGGFVEKGTFFKWGIAVLIIGSASAITTMLMS